MKRVLVAALAAFAMAANADDSWERVGGVQVADTMGLTSAVMKLGEMTGNAMVGTMLAAKIAVMPGSDFFGPMRQGGSVYASIFVDADALAKAEDMDDVDSFVRLALIYPMALEKEEFMSMHCGAFETNGVIRVNGDVFEDASEWDESDITYVAFSPDGKWLVASDTPEQATAALADVPLAAASMEGDILRLSVFESGMDAIRKAKAATLERREKDGGKKLSLREERGFEIIDGIASGLLCIRVDDAGVSMRGTIKTVEGSSFSLGGTKASVAEPFADADADAVIARFNGAFYEGDIEKVWSACAAVLKKNGIACEAPSVSWTFDGSRLSRCVLDVGEMVKFYSNPSNRCCDVDFENACEGLGEVEDLSVPHGLKPLDEPERLFVSIKGNKPKYTAAQRFGAVLPEVSGRPVASAVVYSPCGVMKAVLQGIVAAMDVKDCMKVAPFIALVPDEPKGGVAAACWRDGADFCVLMRMSADEIRSLATAGTAAFMYMMVQSSGDGEGEDCLGDDDDDENEEDFGEEEDDEEDDEFCEDED